MFICLHLLNIVEILGTNFLSFQFSKYKGILLEDCFIYIIVS